MSGYVGDMFRDKGVDIIGSARKYLYQTQALMKIDPGVSRIPFGGWALI